MKLGIMILENFSQRNMSISIIGLDAKAAPGTADGGYLLASGRNGPRLNVTEISGVVVKFVDGSVLESRTCTVEPLHTGYLVRCGNWLQFIDGPGPDLPPKLRADAALEPVEEKKNDLAEHDDWERLAESGEKVEETVPKRSFGLPGKCALQ